MLEIVYEVDGATYVAPVYPDQTREQVYQELLAQHGNNDSFFLTGER